MNLKATIFLAIFLNCSLAFKTAGRNNAAAADDVETNELPTRPTTPPATNNSPRRTARDHTSPLDNWEDFYVTVEDEEEQERELEAQIYSTASPRRKLAKDHPSAAPKLDNLERSARVTKSGRVTFRPLPGSKRQTAADAKPAFTEKPNKIRALRKRSNRSYKADPCFDNDD